jgi:DNA-binding NarL/FixJ family response regulator
MASSPLPSGAIPTDAAVSVLGRGLEASRPGRPIRVIVIDDDARVRAAIGETVGLEADLVVVAEAASADAALALVERTCPAVALVDVRLPDDTSGLALINRLSQRQGCAVVAMSVRSGLRHPALAAGASAFVEKGGDVDSLIEAVRTAALRLR